jgi:hypothetical protein
VLFKVYFDGGNDHNNPNHRWVTLSAIFSDQYSLRAFANVWNATLAKHGIEYLHTTDAVREGLHNLLWDCMETIRNHVVSGNSFRGIIPATTTIDAKEFRIIRDEIPCGPQILSEVVASQCLDRIVVGAREIARRKGIDDKKVFYDLFFDRGEPYRGHIEDRMRHPEFKRLAFRAEGMDIERYIHIQPPIDSRDFAELQAADMFSWCYNHRHTIRYQWQAEMMDIRCDSTLLDRDSLMKPNLDHASLIESLKFPRRSKR